MGNLSELAFMDATAQAELVQKKEVQSIELVEASIERIEKLNPILNAVVTKIYDKAREVVKNGLPEGPFTGVPFLLKDILAFHKGVPLTLGSRLLKNYIPDHDSELVTRLKRSGLVILGKTNVPEFGILPTTEPQLFGPCRNPWDKTRTPGGSSGGSAAAVASGMVPMAHANDGGGSIRIPAACCGVFGLKPTRARNPMGPDFGEGWGGLTAEHAVTRSVRDSAALLDATAGPDIGDPYWAPPPARPFGLEIGQDPGCLRIGHLTSTDFPIQRDSLRAVRAAIKLCTDLGHEVEEITLNLGIDTELFARSFKTLIACGTASTLKVLGAAEEQVEPVTWALANQAKEFDGADYVIAEQLLQRSSRAIADTFNHYDMLIAPAIPEPPPFLGTFEPTPENPLQGFDRGGQFTHLNPLANVAGNPSMSVPLFWNEDDLPIGVLFMGRFGDEASLLRLASQLELAQPWAQKRPPLST